MIRPLYGKGESCCRALTSIAPRTFQLLPNGVRDLVNSFDGFILDQYGVLHDGKTALPGATDCVHRLHNLGKRVVILSNTSQRSKPTLAALPRLGFKAEWFDAAVTSGEEAWAHILRHWRGRKCTMMSWHASGKAKAFLEGLELELTAIEDADFVLAHGAECVVRHDGSTLDTTFHSDGALGAFEAILEVGAQRGLPMVVANADYVVMKPGGEEAHMPGTLGQLYGKLGGKTVIFGKPHRAHFDASVRALDLDPARCIHVGDSLLHDIQGANDAGLASLFVASAGVHARDLGMKGAGSRPEQNHCERLFSDTGQTPTFVSSLFKW